MKKITLLISLMFTLLGIAQPSTNAPTPAHNSADVISVYSDAYTTNVGTNYNPFWGQSGSVNTTFSPTGSGSNYAMAYTNFNYQGTETSTQNAASMEYVHIDVWTANATVLKFSPINNGTGAAEYLVDVPLVNGGWSSVDLPKSAFVGMNWDSIIQIKFDGQAGVSPSTIYLDNIYFWKTSSLPLTAPNTNAPTPTHASADVISVYSDAYTTNVGTNYNPFWGQSGSVNTTYSPTGSGSNYAMAYTNFNYQGTETSTQNAASMDYVHIDVWTANATVLKFSPINNGTGAAEFLVNVPLVNAGWSSVDLPKSAFVGMNWDSIIQIKFDCQAGVSPSTIYLDNIYFWKTSSLPLTAPITNAPTPTHAAADVISVYSDAYTTNVGTNYNPFWGQSGSVNTTYSPTGSGSNYAMAYTNFNYQGTETSTQNASSMEYIHMDVWTANATVLKFSPINNGTGATEYLLDVPLVTGGWSSVDLPKSAFVGMTWDSIFQLKYDGQAGVSPSDIYLDNIYFWKTASLPLTAPITNAPTPTHAQVDVISIYSDAYTNIATDYNPFWGQSGSVNTTYSPTGSGSNYAMAYTNFNYQGTYMPQTNAVNMEYLHIDIWTSTATSVKVSPINNGTGVGEYLVNIPLVNSGWSSVDIPKSDFVGMTWDSVFQLKLDGQSGVSPSTIYLDNIYFWKTAAPTGTPTIGNFIVPAKNTGDAPFVLTDPTSNSSGAFSYSSSNLAVATISGNVVTVVGPGVSIITATQAAAAPYISGSVTANLVVTQVPLVAAPTPPARNSWDVISLFSNAYSDITISDWAAGLGWGGLAPITDLQIAGNDTKKIAFGNFIGVDFGAGHHIDATNMTDFHMDFWIPSATDLVGKVLNPKFSAWTSDTSGETSSFLLTYLPSVNGTWASIDAPISTFTSGNSNPNIRNNVAQFLVSSNLGTIYVDNIYLYRAPTATTDTFNTSNVRLYPNPTSTSLTIEAKEAIESIAIYNVLGQQVISKNPMSNTMTMDVSNLENGLYFVNSTIDGKTSTTKFIKN
jgi:hypothetical protein